MKAVRSSITIVVDPELDPALETEHYVESPDLKARLDIEEAQEPGSDRPSSTRTHGENGGDHGRRPGKH